MPLFENTFPRSEPLPGSDAYDAETDRLEAQTDKLQERLTPEELLRVMSMVALSDMRLSPESRLSAAFTLNNLNAREAAAPAQEPATRGESTPVDTVPISKKDMDAELANNRAYVAANGQTDFDRLSKLPRLSRNKL